MLASAALTPREKNHKRFSQRYPLGLTIPMRFISTQRFGRAFVVTLAFGAVFLTTAYAQNPEIARAQELTRSALKAYRQDDFAASLQFFMEARTLRPDHPTLIYNIAATSALLGKTREAIAELSVLSSMGLLYSPERDSDFVKLWRDPEFKSVLSSFNKNSEPHNRSSIAVQLSERGLISEGVAYDARTEKLYISSVRKRKIICVDRNGVQRDFSRPEDGLWSVLGLKIDVQRRILWACSSKLPPMMGFRNDEGSRAGLFKYDLSTGNLLKKYILADTVNPHTFGDLALNADGEPYVTDSGTSAIYRLHGPSNRLELFIESPSFVNLQGIAFSEDGQSLYVADYSRGIFRIKLETREVFLFPPLHNATLLGIDGLYRKDSSFIAIQNGVAPNRVIRLRFDKRGDLLETWETLEANNAVFDEPTLGAVDGATFYYVANSQWSKVDSEGNIPPDSTLAYHVILKMVLH